MSTTTIEREYNHGLSELEAAKRIDSITQNLTHDYSSFVEDPKLHWKGPRLLEFSFTQTGKSIHAVEGLITVRKGKVYLQAIAKPEIPDKIKGVILGIVDLTFTNALS